MCESTHRTINSSRRMIGSVADKLGCFHGIHLAGVKCSDNFRSKYDYTDVTIKSEQTKHKICYTIQCYVKSIEFQ